MNTAKRVLVTLMLFAFLGGSLPIRAQQRTARASDARVENIIRSLETNTDAYRESLDAALDTSRLNNTNAEDEINRYVQDFEAATDRLRQNFNARRTVNADVQEVFDRAFSIDDFMRRNRLTTRAERDWALVRADLNRLGRNYNIAYRRSGNTFPRNTDDGVFGDPRSGTEDARLTGTYRLDVRRSDDPRTQANAATRNLPLNQRQRAYNNLFARLESPAELALERRGRNITIASTRASQVTIEATGREEVERLPNGRLSRVRADVFGDRLTITSSNENNNNDRTSDYTVVFEALDGGRQLRVTRTVFADRLQQPVVVRSLYDRVSTTARFDINRSDTYSRSDSQVGTTSAGGYIVPNGATIVAVLNTNLSTNEVNDRDRFTMTVRDPGQFEGATIEGYVSDVSRSGRIRGRSGLTLNFERIILRNNRSYNFAGAVESVRTSGGDDVRVDNEGTVRDEDSQTERTVQRAAIGTAVGALIGAIAGGGKGAAIGAVVGAGAGAGSVYAQGRDDLNLSSGTELTIRASAPR